MHAPVCTRGPAFPTCNDDDTAAMQPTICPKNRSLEKICRGHQPRSSKPSPQGCPTRPPPAPHTPSAPLLTSLNSEVETTLQPLLTCRRA
ncbi:Os04g0644750 [Oryza sativa Japonica Group]|uniref:Os04g0644750 protein n=1 Tax=Oryza sativa subsp. japonica TaxID=39947 RepID=A0A0P0WFH2_ORYSJ|nr:hypothetical protein EE612_025897 [Oryza sativa]BAS91303.1 Os04g0644750 [Oryza sativa Japonica Group]